ncbi:transporter substrate-binding domain-containing protein [Litoribacillus peritrichatus]|uniref:Solute-binding protein family 3/N-terminal domain-containing protein n=1 Tax=Litoribacillus peritrichatus TaxID=718191 RepID=A0ABP7N2K2_9GAMM
MNKTLKFISYVTILALSQVSNAETLIFYEGDPPLSHKAHQQPNGVYYDIVTAVFDDLNIQHDIVSLPFKRALIRAKEGKGIVAGIFKTDDRAKFLDFSDNFYSTKVVLFTRKDHSFPFSKISDLEGKVIGAKLGWSYGKRFDQARSNKLFTVIEGESDDLIRQLLLGRTDSFIDNKLTGIHSTKNNGVADLVEIIPIPIDTGPHYLGAKKDTKRQLLMKFNQQLKVLEQDGRYQKILEKYL